MTPKKTLLEIVREIEAFDEEGTIIAAEPWSPESRAQVIDSPDDARASDLARDGMIYFLEVSIARELRDDLALQDERAFCNRLIQYAINDA